jgi:Transglycosylase SLT domain
MMLAWGKRVSDEFAARIIRVARGIGADPNHLMACMAFESAHTFSPSIRNAAGSGAVGLIQFMPSTAKALGTTTAELAAMTAEDQLEYVRRYFSPYVGRLWTLEDCYMAILWPRGIAKPLDYVLFSRGDPVCPARYRQNAGLDKDRDGNVTKFEAASHVRAELERGLQPENAKEVVA